jgi:hypothetical protein
MIEKMPDHDPRALKGFALIAEREKDSDTARVMRAAAAEIERLRAELETARQTIAAMAGHINRPAA